ncbi:Protein sumv-1 [Caenorhabditis elegans]|uniref:Protein sumv-1 n=1 Tax=Caenorhabditis elegans TaxID=6239 RepID=SUMV1_CAEEL|nr:Protein sumv-1 [Caenorhabditis elegans]P46582.2 RecName: Full=Protein sumv-1; AltName: Full=Suppressor of synthetic multivulva protein 1 [Caenorhabditis elegans]CCD66652.1 Protein sumv-1 [Caenorhabditis elegans]|eukprot:NP_498116.2 Protein sumv-1 [Caenorhabditis elegans]
MKQTTRPPAQYIVAPGTRFRLVANEYDKNKYGQCNYASYRTLVRCKQIRSKEELAKHGGRCEEHVEFSKTLENNHKKEVMRCHAENDSKMQRRRFDPWIASNEYISDDDDYLQAAQTVPQRLPDVANDDILDNNSLRYAEYYTDKDILNIKMDLVQKDIDDLIEFKELVTSQAQKEHELLGNDEEEDYPTDMAQRRIFKASTKYSRNDYLTLTTIDPVFHQCCVGPDMDDSLVIVHTMHSILDKIDNFEPIDSEKQCNKPALHLSKFCFDHIILDRSQKMFDVCNACGLTAIGGVDPKCSFHIKSSAIAETTSCPCNRCVQPGEHASPKDEKNSITCYLNSSDDDEPTLGNLSRIESMVSPMQQFSNQSNTLTAPLPRRYQGPPAQVLRPPQMGPPPGINQVPYQPKANRTPPMTSQQLHEQQKLKMQEEEMMSQTCASDFRVRPIDASQFGGGKKKQRLPPRRSPSFGTSPNSYQFHQQSQKKMPSIISTAYNSSPGKMNFQGWKNQSTSSATRPLPQPRFPVHAARSQQPKMIPLEQTQDSIEDDIGPSPMFQGPEPSRRGVPYYKNAYRRTELPSRHAQHSPLTPSTSTSSSQLLAPPKSPQPGTSSQTFRSQASRLPIAPHRAIAAGLNPADVGTRPAYRSQMAGQRPGMTPSAQQGSPQLISPPRQGSMMPVAMNQSPQAVRRQTPVPPYRLMGPQRVTTSYTVVRSGSSSSVAGPSRSSVASGSQHTALDTVQHDPRLANINVRTFLSIGNRDLSTLTQDEIDLLMAGNSPEKGGRKAGAPGAKESSKAAGGAQKGTSAASTSVPEPTKSSESSVDPQSDVSFSNPSPAPEVIEKVAPAAMTITSNKRKIDETLASESTSSEATLIHDTTSSSSAETVSGEPPAKKSSDVSAPVPSPEKEKEKIDRPKTPKSSTKRTTPTPSGRTPRAAAIAANQAISHSKPNVPSASTSSSAASTDQENPLDLLAELSVAAAAEEQQQAIGSTSKNGGSTKKTQRKSPSRSSIGKKRENSEEYEEEL